MCAYFGLLCEICAKISMCLGGGGGGGGGEAYHHSMTSQKEYFYNKKISLRKNGYCLHISYLGCYWGDTSQKNISKILSPRKENF